MQKILRLTVLAITGIVTVLAADAASAGTISVAWDAVPEAAGYRVYYSTVSGQYNTNDFYQVGRVTETTLNGFQDCTTYYLAVKAFNSAGESDAFSNEITGWARPTLSGPTQVVRQGTQVTLELQGSNFMNGVDVSINNPNVIVESTSVSQCDTLVIALTVDPLNEGVRAAEIGSFDVTVINPDLVFFEAQGSLQVELDSARFDFNRSDATTTNRVDGKDLVWLAQVFGLNEGSPLYDPNYDLDGNGFIDGTDLSYIASNMGGCWTGTNWTPSDSGWNIASCPQGMR